MDRVSGAFKRYSQMMALIIGLILSLVLNVNSIDLTFYLWRNPPSARRSHKMQPISSYRRRIGGKSRSGVQNFRNQFVGLSLPIGWGFTRVSGAAFYADNCQLFPKENQLFGVPIVGSNLCITPPNSNSQGNLPHQGAGDCPHSSRSQAGCTVLVRHP